MKISGRPLLFLAPPLLALMLRAAPGDTATESDARAAVARNTTVAQPVSSNARELFLAVERFARTPSAAQAEQLPEFYMISRRNRCC